MACVASLNSPLSFQEVRMADRISLSVRVVNFSWPDGPVWTVLGLSRQYRWLIVSAYQYVWVIFHGLMDQFGQSLVHPGSTDG